MLAVRRAARTDPARDPDVRRHGRAAGRHDHAAAEGRGDGGTDRIAAARVSDRADGARDCLHVIATPVVVFTTVSDIEASVVMALLDSQGIAELPRLRATRRRFWPMAVNALGRDPHRRRRRPSPTRRGASSSSHREDVGVARCAAARRVRRAAARASATASAIADCSSTR